MSVIHSCWVLLACRSALSRGSASSSTKTSREISRVGRASTASPIHSRLPARFVSMGEYFLSSGVVRHRKVGAGRTGLDIRPGAISGGSGYDEEVRGEGAELAAGGVPGPHRVIAVAPAAGE